MRVFLAGATGAIGRPLVRQLVAAGHEVTAMTRSPEKVADLRVLGATPVVCDALDREALQDAVVTARPDAVVHQLTQIPPDLNPKRYAEQFVVTDRLRTEATQTLVEAAVETGARRVVAQSVAFVYAAVGGPVKSEEDPLQTETVPGFQRSLDAIRKLERLLTETAGIDGIVLRYGYLYGPGTSYAPDGQMAHRVRRRRLPIIGGGTGVWSFVHVEDAAAATVLALARDRSGVYNVVDDEPARVSEWLPVYAEALGAKPPVRVPAVVGRLGAGRRGVDMMTNARGASNEKARRELEWRPQWPSWRQGFVEALSR